MSEMTTFTVDMPFEDMSDDYRLELIQRERVSLLKIITHDSTGVRNRMVDIDGIHAARGILKDIGSDIFTKRRLSTDDIMAETDKQVADLAERIFNKDRGSRRDNIGMSRDGERPSLDLSRLPTFAITEGETSDVGNDVDLDEIRRKGRLATKGAEG